MTFTTDNASLLLYRVGPVLCCAPSLPVLTIIPPPAFTRTPGRRASSPGIFKYAEHIVQGSDLRYRFGVDEAEWADPGRMIVTDLTQGAYGFWVDEILAVIEKPADGWGRLPAHLPRGVFSRTLLLKGHIYLYADFQMLLNLPEHGYLRAYIETLLEEQKTIHIQQEHKPVQQLSVKPQSTDNTNTPERPVTDRTSIAENKSTSVKPSAAISATSPVNKQPVITQQSSSTPTETSPLAKQSVTGKAKTQGKERTTIISEKTVPNKIVTPRHDNRSATPPINTPEQHTARQTPVQNTASSGGIWVFLFALLLFIGASGWLVWLISGTSTEPDNPVVVTEKLEPVTFDAPMPVSDEPEVNVDETVVSKSETPIVSEPPLQISEAQQALTLPAPTKQRSDVQQTEDVPPTQRVDPVIEQYEDQQVSIEKDEQGVTIYIDVPEQTTVFKQEEPIELRTETAAPPSEDNALVDGDHTIEPDPPQQQAPEQHIIRSEITHIVVKGDTLWHIAIRYVNDPFRYPELARLSNIKNPDLIYPGDRVRIVKRVKSTRNKP